MPSGPTTRTIWDGRAALLSRYRAQEQGLQAVVDALVTALNQQLREAGIKATVRGRAKTFEAFWRKLLEREGPDPGQGAFEAITDVVGLRVVTPFMEDIGRVALMMREHYELEEVDDKALALSVGEFGYDSTHLLIAIPRHVLSASGPVSVRVAEVQLRTTLQDAWAEVEHELVYKADLDVVDQQIRRKLLALNATLSLADTIFQDIRTYQQSRYRELLERHDKMMAKVATIPEKAGVARLARQLDEEAQRPAPIAPADTESALSNLVVRALRAHLDADLEEAVDLYSQVLAIQPTYAIYNHRGIAYFALSDYERAIDDFTQALELAPGQARAYTNRGLARRMAGQLHEALADLDRSLEIDPHWADTVYGRALTRFDLGDIPGALRDCDRAIALKPNFKQVLRFKRFISDSDL